MHKSQKGFALVESLLIILILVIVAFAGYYVWHTQQNTDKVNSDTLKASQSTPTSNTSGSTKYLTISQWGLKGPNSATVHLQYKIGDFNGIPDAEFTSSELLAAGGNDCISAGGIIVRYSGSDKNAMNVTNPNQTIEQGAANGDIIYYSFVNDKYYVFIGPQAACGDPARIQTASVDTLNAVKALTQGLRAE